MKIVFLLEEYSMRAALEVIIPRLIPDMDFQCITHEGKQDLEKSIPRKLRGWKEHGVKFVVLRDQDSADCQEVKKNLLELCKKGRRTDTLVRVVCRALESWFLGDLSAVEVAYEIEGLADKQKKRRYRDPDHLVDPFREIKRLVPSYQKVGGARRIAPHLNLERPGSHSFGVFLHSVKKMAKINKS